ncbi:uncharacterized protein LOC119304315 [Triticum dicoccoides]|uniref:uncharacterized protein LOC119304315 n=1 Tax=Triticum dicoccoides TaxID=85692 RepID=UPI00188F27F9|nr:uncharacterized protein LOC119304315 [Triticum dicoccoides]
MRSTVSRGPYPPHLTRKPREEEIDRAFAGRRRRRGVDASQGGGSARLRRAVSAAAASASTLLHIAACVRKHGQATTSRWRRQQRQHARCAKSGKMGAACLQAFQDGVPDGSEHARPAHTRYASEYAGSNMHREIPEKPSQYRAPPYWTNPATPSSPPLTGLC